MKILITGVAGFIGFHLANRLASEGFDVFGIDNINDYYDVSLKYGRLKESGFEGSFEYGKVFKSSKYESYRFSKVDLKDKESIDRLFREEKFDAVCNLAAQAGVRYSLKNPYSYIDSNIYGFLNILEACRHFEVENLCFASSSSVYGLNKKQPFSEKDNVDHPISLYAATKKSNELMAHTYSYLYGVRATGLRFFTVYGPWGRPDMALFKFVKNILEDKPIDVYNYGKMERDFTYIDDIIEGVVRVIKNPAKPNDNWDALNPDPSSSKVAYKIYNIGNNSPVKLDRFIEIIEKELGKKAKRNLMPMQPGDVESTYADVSALIEDLDYKPYTPPEVGIKRFIEWYRSFYKI
ncbi:NAD-dependent epimerase [Hippea alviniae]|uniref:NAD-dependent epimerase n=1 Tax=Hippea alviniae TaxID=1279027 RepID=UPI0003B55831|nr:NAD-dependent epimerase [Hippea alviniae]